MRRHSVVIAILAALISMLLCVGLGPVSISPGRILRTIAGTLPLIGRRVAQDATLQEATIVLQARLPRVVMGFAIGGALATGGAVLQGMAHNALAEPFILGASYGAASAATLGLALGWFARLGIYQLPVNGMIGAAVALAFVMLYAQRGGRMDMTRLLLGGVGVSMFGRALVQFVIKMSPRAFVTGSAAFWTEGGLAGIKLDYLKWPLMMIIACLCCLAAEHRALDAINCGEETAHTLGIPVRRMQWVLIGLVSAMTGIAVAVSGGIGFIGLVIPNLARLFTGGSYRRLILTSLMLGGIFLIWCDVLARTLFAPVEISAGIVTAILGGALFLVVLKLKAR